MLEVLYVIKNLSERILKAESNLERLESLRESFGRILDGTPPSTSVTSRVEQVAESIAGCERKLRTLKKVREVCRLELYDWLEVYIADENVRQVLFYRYGFQKSFREIARQCHMSLPSVYRLHKLGKNLIVDDSR